MPTLFKSAIATNIPLCSAAMICAALLLSVPLCQAQNSPAPTSACSFDDAPVSTPIRMLQGNSPIPYHFACGHNRPEGVCATDTRQPGIIVSKGAEKNGWTCITGGDSTSGWVPSSALTDVPSTPQIPASAWIGWWRQGEDGRDIKNDRLHITSTGSSGELRVTGRAYWYGLNNNVHTGGIDAHAIPAGPYLHLVDGTDLSGCVLDLQFNPATHEIAARDNMNCGGMNVRFDGDWERFTPQTKRKPHHPSPQTNNESR